MTISIRAAARRWGCSRYTAEKRLEAGEVPPEPDQTGPRFPDIKEFPKDKDALWEAMFAFQYEIQKWDIHQSSATADLTDETQPIGIVVSGDWHIGNENTNLRELKADIDLIAQTPGLYCFHMGDLIDGYVKPNMPTGSHEAMVRVRTQRHLAWDACSRLAGKVLCTVSGQHDHWGVQQADFDPIEWVSSDHRVPYLGHGGLLTLKLSGQDYRIHVRHKGRYRSQVNVTHGIKQHWRFVQDADIGCHADLHVPAIEHVLWKGEHRLAIRPGSYKPTDDFCDAGDFGLSPAVMPTIILWPDRRRIQAMWTLGEGAEYVSRLRK